MNIDINAERWGYNSRELIRQPGSDPCKQAIWQMIDTKEKKKDF